jgi:transposase-like protein
MNGRNHSRKLKIQLCKQVESGEKRPAQIYREHEIAESSLLKGVRNTRPGVKRPLPHMKLMR